MTWSLASGAQREPCNRGGRWRVQRSEWRCGGRSEDVTDDGVGAATPAGSMLDGEVLVRHLTSPIASTTARSEPATIPKPTVNRDFFARGALHPSDTLCRFDGPLDSTRVSLAERTFG